MRIGFISNGTHDELHFAAIHGLPCVELNIHPDSLETWQAKRDEIRSNFDAYEVELNAVGIWGRNYLSDDEQERQKALDELRAVTDLAADWGAPIVMLGGGLNEALGDQAAQAKKAVDVLGKSLDYIGEKGLKPAFYNCHWTNCVIGPPAWDVVLPAREDVGIKFDPSHPYHDFLKNQDQAFRWDLQLRDYGHRVIHTHAKDVLTLDGEIFDEPPAGMGDINWGTFCAILHHHDYQGDINLEPHSRTWRGDRYVLGILIGARHMQQFVQ